MFSIVGEIFDISSGNNSLIRQQLHTGIPAIASCITMQELDPVLTRATLLDIFIGTYPGNKMTLGYTSECLIPEGDHESSIFGIYPLVTVSCKFPGCIGRSTPGLSFIFTIHHQAAAVMCVLAQEGA